jgi:predicted amidohydrolase
MEAHMSDDKLRVGVAQLSATVGDTDANLSQHLELVARARAEKLEMLVFPELSLSGYPVGSADFHKHALNVKSRAIARLAAECQGLTAVVGLLEETVAAQFYNSCYVVRDGEVVHIHRKLNLATYGSLEEGKYFAQGRYVETFEVSDWWRASILICADLWNPALVHIAALHGATMLIAPTNSARGAVSSRFSNPDGWDITSRFYAMMYGMPIIMANRVGTDQGLTFWGGSRVIDPFGGTIAQTNEEDDLLIAELDYEDVREARLQLPTVRDSNLALVYRELSRLQQLIGVPERVRRL